MQACRPLHDTLCTMRTHTHKQPAFSLNSKVSFDGRTQAMNLIKSLPLDYLMCLVYPRLYALHMLTEKVSLNHCLFL